MDTKINKGISIALWAIAANLTLLSLSGLTGTANAQLTTGESNALMRVLRELDAAIVCDRYDEDSCTVRTSR